MSLRSCSPWRALRSASGTAVLLAVLSGSLYAASFPPLSWSALGWLALGPLFVASGLVGPRGGFGLGVIWCLVASLGVAGFLPGMVRAFFGGSAALGWLVFLGTMALVAPLYGVWVSWLSWVGRRGGITVWLAAAGFGLCELARTSLNPLGGWALLAVSQVPSLRIAQSLDWLGPYGLGMLLAAASFVPAAVVSRRLHATPALELSGRQALAVAAACAAVGVYGPWQLSRPIGPGPTLEVALVQAALDPERRWDARHRDANLERYLELTRAAAETDPDLILWPEYAVDFYLREASPQREALLEASRSWRGDLLLGGPHYRPRTSPPRYHNSAFLIRDGHFRGRYDKIQLLPFAESNPLGSWMARPVHYSAGERLEPLAAASARVGTLLCSEAIGPRLARRLSAAGAEILANPSNDDWFGQPAAARLHLHTAIARAIENRRSLVRTTPAGFSAIVDPRGRVQALGERGAAGVLRGQVRGSTRATPYQRAGDTLGGLALLVAAGGTWRRARRSRPCL